MNKKKSRRNVPPNFLGQHLLHHRKTIDEIVRIANVNTQDIVLDLGAGKGALTNLLSHKAKKVLAVEYDEKFIGILKDKFRDKENTIIIQQDILKLKLPKEDFIVVANIPYAITTPILKKLLNDPVSNFQKGVILMEKGAAKRFTSKFVKDPYVIAWRMWFDLRFEKSVPRKYFSPPPRVDSAIVSITRKKKPLVPYQERFNFWGLVDYALRYPNVCIDDALRGVFTVPQIKQLKRNLKINSEIPVGTLSAQQWAIIHETMIKYVPKFRWPKVRKEKFYYLKR